ncbi:MAG: hypothetical protein N2376_00415 [Clostridia bacterium]|nr:hypothetical protein [Clostridia bacterium]
MLKGKIDVLLSPVFNERKSQQNPAPRSFRLFTLDRNTFLCVNDILRSGQSLLSLKTKEVCELFCFPASSLTAIKTVLSTQKDYSAYIVTSLALLIDLSYSAYQKLLPVYHKMNVLVQNLSVYYWAIKDKFNCRFATELEALNPYRDICEGLKKERFNFFPVNYEKLMTRSVCGFLDEEEESLDWTGIEYFSSILNVPMEHRKGFFNYEPYVCEYHVRKGSEILDTIILRIKYLISKLANNLDCLCTSHDSLMNTYSKMALDLRQDREAAFTILTLLQKTIEEVCPGLEKLQNEFDYLTEVRAQDLKDMLPCIKENLAIDTSLHSGADTVFELPEELHNSLDKILAYCLCPQDASDRFKQMLSQFRAIRDKTSLNPEERALREAITQEFFSLYEEAFKRAQSEKHCSKLISMFLNYGYMDENLITREQAISLYRLCDKEYASSGYSVYTAKQWLEMIHQNKREPSINEFGQDYADVFRDMKKRRMVTDSDKARYDGDYTAKVNFEITNMLKTNQKVCHGHMGSYFPVLHKDMITRDLEKAVVTPSRLEKAFNDLLAIDFSAFYREIWYKNDLKGIEKEPIMKEIRPDIIIVPTFGSRASMWQEIAGRNRSAPGRFIVPAFTDEDLDRMVLRLFGSFRWELCRTMAGVAWNDITEKSLTSEYTDYIQFFKNNNDLTEDAKEKIKDQIQRNRSMMREIFTGDYESWVRYESQGIQRLNKIARSIMMRYCPPSKEIREVLSRHPAYSDFVLQVNYAREKTAKSLTAKYTKLFKNGPMDRDMELNLIFYRDL